MKCKRNIFLVTLLFITLSISAQILTVEITNIRNNKGNIALGIFIDDNSFELGKPIIKKTYSKTNLINGKLKVKIKLKSGVYGISVLDDENADGEMKYNWCGLPKEGFGFSNFYQTGITKPNFKNFDFIVGEKDKTVQVKMKYFKKK